MNLLRRPWLLIALFILASVAYWLLPIKGKLVYQNGQAAAITFPYITLTHQADTFSILVQDPTPWTHVRLETAGTSAELVDFGSQDENGLWQWRWQLPTSAQNEPLHLYRSCATGCQAWGNVRPTTPPTTNSPGLIPTKLGIVLANPARDWHGRQGWDVEITYAQLADEEFWGVDDLAQRVRLAEENGLRVLLRIEFGQGQSLPAADDALALDQYLQFVQRIARDARLQNVYGFIIGSNFNTNGGNSQFPDSKVTPRWYARIFNGYGVDTSLHNNALAVIRRENPQVRVLAGPVSPWNTDQGDGARDVADLYRIDVPWLDYMNALVYFLDQGAADKAVVGITGMAPDGFAVQAFGRVNAGDGELERGAREPLAELSSAEYPHAQMGFRIFEDWLESVNRYDYTRGKPLFINATNTFDPLTGSFPAENYPAGWLTTALQVIDEQPQIEALCWFIDGFEHDEQWAMFSLIEPRGALAIAASEFDTLLQLEDQ